MANQVIELEENVNDAKIELNKLQAKVKEAKALEKKLKLLRQKRKVIEDLDASREDAVRLLDKMTEVLVPGRMWLSSFTASGGTVNLNGTAMDNKTVADFMTNLQKVEQFSGVNLVVTSQQQYKPGVNFKSFTINFNRTLMKPTAEEDKAQK